MPPPNTEKVGKYWESYWCKTFKEVNTHTFLDLETYITICKIDSQWEFAVGHKELRLVLCDNLEGWDGGGRWEGVSRGRGHTYTYG